MRLKDLLAALDEAASFSLQEDYDNSGIQIGHPDKEVTKALVCLDVNTSVVKEAINESCDVIISHHPVIFKGIKQITGIQPTDKVIILAIQHDICIVAVHTNLDAVHTGVNMMLAEQIGLKNLQVLEPKAGLLKKLVTYCPVEQAASVRMALFEAGSGHIGDYDCCSFNVEGHGTFRAGEQANPFVGSRHELHTEKEIRIETVFPSYLEKPLIHALVKNHPYEEVAYDIYRLDNTNPMAGSGMVGTFDDPISEPEFLAGLKRDLHVPCLRHSPLKGRSIRKVAVCGGSGGFLTNKAMVSGADAFVTAELKYNQFMDAGNQLLLVDAGHYETEQFTKELLAGIIQKKMINFAVLISQVNTNPVQYF